MLPLVALTLSLSLSASPKLSPPTEKASEVKICRNCPMSVERSKKTLSSPQSRYPKLLVFVSFAIPMEALKVLAGQVNALGGAVVFRGLVEGSFKKTAVKLKELGCEATVDPTLFEAYEVTAVPTFVLRKSATNESEQQVAFDRISGNVSLHYVLEEFAQKGEVQEEARTLLQKLKEKR